MTTTPAQNYAATALQAWFDTNPGLAARGIDESTWNALCSTIYPGAKPESVVMAVDYCRARGLDVMLKPVHLVPMNVKDAQTGQYAWRDVPMPGVGLYRIQADRSKTYAGADEPEFGPSITQEFKGKNGKVTVTFPEWCRYTVHKIIGDRIVQFHAKEYWIENYASEGKDNDAPNSMWKKRPFAQLAKCAEAQALRKAWPEIGQEPTAEEMEGKSFDGEIKDINPAPVAKSLKSLQQSASAAAPEFDAAPADLNKAISLCFDCQTESDLGQWWQQNCQYAEGTEEHKTLSMAYFDRLNEIKQNGSM